MNEEEYMRVVMAPYWCRGDPLLWETRNAFGHRIGIADLAREGKIGKFNLCWWLLDCPSPPRSADTYKRAPLLWALDVAPTLTLNSKSLVDIAAMMPLDAFNARINRLLDNLPPEGVQIVSAYGVTPQVLRRLCSRGNQAA